MEVKTKGTNGSRKRAYFLSRLSRSTRQPLEIESLSEKFFLNSTVSTIVSNFPKLKSKVHTKLGSNVRAVAYTALKVQDSKICYIEIESPSRRRLFQRRKKSQRMRVSGSVERYVRGEASLPSRRSLDSRGWETSWQLFPCSSDYFTRPRQ